MEDVKSPLSGSFASAYRDPVTPPALSPRKYRTSHANSTLSIRTPVLSRSQSVDNFSQPSPGIYRGPRSPGSPPARTSSRNATHPAPDFFSEVHHATPQERELLSQCIEPAIVPAPTHTQPGHVIDHNLPHAITTADEIALTLKPSTTRSTLTLADVPEEDELRSVKRVSEETPRPVTADPTLRHAMSFPSNGCSPCRRSVSASRKSLRQSGMMPVGRFTVQDPDAPSENAHAPAAAPRYRRSRGMSTGVNGIDACWEDDIDYCYQHEAEADCDFDWDRVSMDNTPTMNGSHNVRPLVDTHRDSAESLSKTYEKLELPDEVNGLAATATAYKPGCHHLPRLQTSLPDLDFSAASSAKSSMASLRGPVTPSQQLPSPKKIRPILQLSKSTDTFNLDSYFAAHEGDLPWSQDESFQKAPSWDHAMNFNYPFNNLSLPGCSSRTSLRSNRPPLSTHHSSENVVLPHSSSRAHTRHNTNSSGSFPELVCSQNYREQASIVAEQIADRIAALQVTHANDAVASPKSHATQTKTTASHSILKETASASKSHSLDGEELTEESITSTGPKGPSVSVATFASKLRSNSTASSASGSSSMRASRVSYSLFPSVPSARS